jgi:hypothetical protein
MGHDGPIELNPAKLLPYRPEYFAACPVVESFPTDQLDFSVRELTINPLYPFTPALYDSIKHLRKLGWAIALYPSQ